MLTWWQGRILEVGFGQGENVIYDSSYRQIARVRAGNGYHADLHEIRLQPDGTAWVDAFDPIHMNLSALHGRANGVLTDCVVQQIDIKTGLVMWEWHALGHVPLTDSNNPRRGTTTRGTTSTSTPPTRADSGDVLLSAPQHLDAVRRGHPQRRDPLAARRQAQQLQRLLRDALLLAARRGMALGRADLGVRQRLDATEGEGIARAAARTRRVQPHGHAAQSIHQPSRRLLASSQGNTLALPGGDWLMGYGGLPNFTEYDASGHVLLDGSLGKNVQDFKTFIAPWSGHPRTRPAVSAKKSGSSLSVAVSWNGATDVASWRVQAGSSSTSLAVVATAPRAGFETTIKAASAGPYVQVQGLDAQGNVIGTSATVKA